MSVVVAIEEIGPWRKQLTVQVPGPAVEAETQRVVREFQRRAKVPGFRKGKVPAELVLQRFQKDIEQEVIDRLLPRYWHQARAESDLEPLLPPRVEQVEMEPGTSLTFVATVETRPQIRLGNLSGFQLPEMEVEPSPEEVEQTLEELRREAADWVPVDRAAARGDLVTAHLTELGPGGEPRGEAQAASVEVGDPQVWGELSAALSGLTADGETEFSRPDPGGGEERRFRAKVTAVKERELPPLDDGLARRLGDFHDLDALRREIERRLRSQRVEERGRRRERAVLDQLRERHPLELPAGVVEHEIEHLLGEYAEGLAHRGVDLERANIDWQALAQEVRPQAERRVHSRLLLDAVAERLEIAVSEPEFEAHLAAMARIQGRSTVELRKALDESGKLSQVRARLRRGKALTQLLGGDGDEGGSEESRQERAPARG